MITWSKGLDTSEWPWREDDRTEALEELNNVELTPIHHSKTPINTKVSTRILQLSSRLLDLRVELSSLFDLSGGLHPSGVASLKRLQLTLDANWSQMAKSLVADQQLHTISGSGRIADLGLGWIGAFNSLTELDLIFSHPISKHSRKADYDLSGFLNALAGDDSSSAGQQHRQAPFSALSRVIARSLPLPKLQHLTLILWDLDPNAVRSFLFCRAPDGPRFVARTSGVNGVSKSIGTGSSTFTAVGCRISLICCSFTTSEASGEPPAGRGEISEPSLHLASYEEFQSFWFYLRGKK